LRREEQVKLCRMIHWNEDGVNGKNFGEWKATWGKWEVLGTDEETCDEAAVGVICTDWNTVRKR
jgi:hypothetical protein